VLNDEDTEAGDDVLGALYWEEEMISVVADSWYVCWEE